MPMIPTTPSKKKQPQAPEVARPPLLGAVPTPAPAASTGKPDLRALAVARSQAPAKQPMPSAAPARAPAPAALPMQQPARAPAAPQPQTANLAQKLAPVRQAAVGTDITSQFEQDYGSQADQKRKQDKALAEQQGNQGVQDWNRVANTEWERAERKGAAPVGDEYRAAWLSSYEKYPEFRGLSPEQQQAFLDQEYRDSLGEGNYGTRPTAAPNTTAPRTIPTALDEELLAALEGTEGYGFSDEEMQLQQDEIQRKVGSAQFGVAQQMAARGLGSSGLTGVQLGNVEAAALGEWADLVAADKQMAIDERINVLKTLLQNRASELSEANRKSISDRIAQLEEDKFGYTKEEAASGDQWTELVNALALLGGEEYSSGALAWALSESEKGTPFSDIVKQLDESLNGELFKMGVTGDAEGGTGTEAKEPITEGVEVGGDEYGKPVTYGLNVNAWQQAAQALRPDGTTFMTGDYETTGEIYQAAYDQYEADSVAGGFPPLSYPEWLSYQLTTSGQMDTAQTLTGMVWGQNYP